MNSSFKSAGAGLFLALLVTATLSLVVPMSMARASGGSTSGGGGGGGGGGTTSAEVIKVSKCYYVAGNGTLLVNASSSVSTAHLYLYLPSGQLVGEVQNGGGGRYGGTVFYVGPDPVVVGIFSSAGGYVSVPTTPFVL